MKTEFTQKDYKDILIELMISVKQLEEAFVVDPDEIEISHDIRVNLRKVRSLISFVEPLVIESIYDRIQNQLRFIADRFGYIRQIDVIAQEWLQLCTTNSVLNGHIVLRDTLIKERRIERNALLRYIQSGQMTMDLNHGMALIWLFDIAEGDLTDFIVERFEKWNHSIIKALSRMDAHNQPALHRLRIRFKKVRYVQSHLELVQNNPYLKMKELKNIQDILGEINDTFVNIDLLEHLITKYELAGLKDEVDLLIGLIIKKRTQLLSDVQHFIDERKGKYYD